MLPNYFIFIRHAHYDKAGLSEAERKHASISDKGWDQAISIGEWLAKEGIKPDLVISTKARRAQETAAIAMLAAEHEPEFREVNGGFALGKASLDEKLEQWQLEEEHETVAFVGHHSSQEFLATKLGPPVVNEVRAVIVYQLVGSSTWQLVKWMCVKD